MTPQMRYAQRGAVMVVLGVIVLAGVAAPPVRAQSSNPLDLLLAAVSSLQASVNLLVSPTQANVRITPPLWVSLGDFVDCTVINAASGNRTVRIETFGAAVEPEVRTVTIEPGGIDVAFAEGIAAGPIYCKYTVTNGTRADIRAAMRIFSISLDDPDMWIAAE